MKKLIEINDEDLKPLKILAAAESKNLTQYIKDILTEKVNNYNFIIDSKK